MIRKVTLGIVALVVVFAVGVIFYSTYLRRIKLSETGPPVDKTREARVLTSFFGLDALPAQSLMLYWRAIGKNGMPVVFSQEVDPSTLDNSDFEVTARNGEKFDVEFVTLKPANDEFELRTVLLIGEYGTYPDSPPETLTIIGDLLSRSGPNYRGQSVNVIPLPDGPTISYAEYFVIDDNYPYVPRGAGCDCPKEETVQAVRTVWAGGVRALNGKELGDDELASFNVTIVQGNDTILANPFMLADLGDNDNNIDLCLKEQGIPILVEADANIAMDPRDDPNPATRMTVMSRW